MREPMEAARVPRHDIYDVLKTDVIKPQTHIHTCTYTCARTDTEAAATLAWICMHDRTLFTPPHATFSDSSPNKSRVFVHLHALFGFASMRFNWSTAHRVRLQSVAVPQQRARLQFTDVNRARARAHRTRVVGRCVSYATVCSCSSAAAAGRFE